MVIIIYLFLGDYLLWEIPSILCWLWRMVTFLLLNIWSLIFLFRFGRILLRIVLLIFILQKNFLQIQSNFLCQYTILSASSIILSISYIKYIENTEIYVNWKFSKMFSTKTCFNIDGYLFFLNYNMSCKFLSTFHDVTSIRWIGLIRVWTSIYRN